MKPSSIISVFASFFLVAGAVLWPSFRITQAHKLGEAEAGQAFRKLQVEAQTMLTAGEDAVAKPWDAFAKRIWSIQDRLLCVVISDKKSGILYALPGASPYYLAPDPKAPGVPRFDMPSYSGKHFSIMLGGGMILDALYITLQEEDVLKPLSESALAIMVLCVIFAGVLLATAPARALVKINKAAEPLAPAVPEIITKPLDYEDDEFDIPLMPDVPPESLYHEDSDETAESITAAVRKPEPMEMTEPVQEIEKMPVVESLPEIESLTETESLHEIESLPKIIPEIVPAPVKTELHPDIQKALLVDDLTLQDPDAIPKQPDPAMLPIKKPVPLEVQGPVGLFDPETTLGWESYLRERLGSELRRAASFEQDMVLLIASYDSCVRESEEYRLFAKTCKDFFSFNDMAFLFGESAVAIILPNIDIDHAIRMSEELLKKNTFIFQGKANSLKYLEMFMGLSSRSGRLVDADRIIAEALAALKKARVERDTHIMAFRPDPEKFRAYLTN